MVITRASQACDAGSIPVARSSYVAPFLRAAFFIALLTPSPKLTMKFSRLRKGVATANTNFAVLNVPAVHVTLKTILLAVLIIVSGVGHKNHRR